MKRPIDRRTVLVAAGAVPVAAAAGTVAAQATDIQGAVVFESGADVPEGVLVIYLEDRAAKGGEPRRRAEMRLRSDGKSKTVAFSVASPAAAIASPNLQIVARLERADGWLVARGSAPFEAGSPVRVTLKPAMY
jgi:hypothetical protein